jgi:hypothetical protein
VYLVALGDEDVDQKTPAKHALGLCEFFGQTGGLVLYAGQLACTRRGLPDEVRAGESQDHSVQRTCWSIAPQQPQEAPPSPVFLVVCIGLEEDIPGDVQDHAPLEQPPMAWRMCLKPLSIWLLAKSIETEVGQQRGLARCGIPQHQEPGELMACIAAGVVFQIWM